VTAPSPFPGLSFVLSRAQIVAWRNALLIVFGTTGVGLASWVSRTPRIGQQLDAGTSQIGLLIFGMAFGAVVGLLVSSGLVGRLGPRYAMRLCLTIAGIGMAVAGIGIQAGSFTVAVAGLATLGFGTSTCDVSMNVSGAANERALGWPIMPIYHAGFSMGAAIGALVGAGAEAAGVSIIVQFGVVGLFMVGVGWIITRSVIVVPVPGSGPEYRAGRDVPGSAPVRKRSWFARWRDRRTLLVGLIVLGMALAEGSANDWLALAMVDGHGVSPAFGAAALGVFVISMTVGRLAGPWLLKRFGRVPVLQASAGLAIVGLVIVVFAPLVPVAVVGVVLWGLGAALGFPVGMSAAADDPSMAAERVSTVATIGYLAFLVGPPVIGFLGEAVGLLNGLLIVLVMIVVAGFASSAAREPARPPH
jgi:fucose permease